MEREIGEARLTGAFGMKVAEFETPAIGLPAGMLARDPIKPALNAAGEPEVARIYRQHEPAIENTLVEPVGQHEFHALDTARSCGELFPFIDPGELLAPPMLAVSNGGAHDRRLQPRQSALEQVVVADRKSTRLKSSP